jgi:subtilisin family serine protease
MSSKCRIGLRLTTVAALALFAFACADQPAEPPQAEGPTFAKAAGESSEDTYVFTAGKWGKKQTKAIESAGGTLTFSHEDGVGVAVSADPDFLENALNSGAFTNGAADQILEWQPPLLTYDLEESVITPGDESFYGYQWNMPAILAPEAWDAGCTGAGVRIAILDGGISSDHGDIEPNLDAGASASFVPGTAFDDDGPGFRHASHVAAIAAAPDNSFGVIGVAPEATIIGVKVLHYGSGAFSWIIEGMYYAATSMSEGGGGADIINMSLRGIVKKGGGAGPLVSAMNRAANYAARQGVLVISAAGNDGFNFDHSWDYTVLPAEAGNSIAISATGPTGFIFGGDNFRDFATYSNSGNSLVHVAAPGGDSRLYPGPGWWYDMVLSASYRDGGIHWYTWAQGTSMAAPHAAGVAALIKQQNPNISVGAWKSRLAQTADDEGKKGHDPQFGRGFVNAYAACMGK